MEHLNPQNKDIVHDFDGSKKRKSNGMKNQIIFTAIIVIILGVGTGYIASSLSSSGNRVTVSNSSPKEGEIVKGATFGVSNTKEFPNTAEGVLREGGIEGEGEFHLVRPGGDSQNVYLTSTTIDLSQFVGKKIKVWGKTYDAEKAGWLMDAGKVEVL